MRRPVDAHLLPLLLLLSVAGQAAAGEAATGQAATGQAVAADAHAHHHHHVGSAGGMVMNGNRHRLPAGCSAVSEDSAITVHAGRRYAEGAPGAIFGFSQHEVRVAPCARLTVTFVNDDEVRHQWMVHGLPRYLYPGGMFHIEAMGGQQQTGTFIVPAAHRTYLIHCDMAQHMEKGLRGQLVVGRGSGDLWSVPGVSDHFYRSSYLPGAGGSLLLGLMALAGGFVVVQGLRRWRRRRTRSSET